MVVTEIKERIKQSINWIVDPYYKLIDNRWPFLSEEEKKQISGFIRDHIDTIKPFYNPPNREKILNSFDEYAHYRGSIISFPIVYEYFRDIRNLDELIKAVEDGYFPFRRYDNVAKPQPENHYIENAFGMNTKPGEQKEGLIEILKIIGEIMARGYPACYYRECNYPIQYHIEKPLINNGKDNNQNPINVRIFIRRDIPDAIVGYLIYKLLNNMKLKNMIIPPSGNQYFLIEDKIGINPDHADDPYIDNILHSFNTLQKIY